MPRIRWSSPEIHRRRGEGAQCTEKSSATVEASGAGIGRKRLLTTWNCCSMVVISAAGWRANGNNKTPQAVAETQTLKGWRWREKRMQWWRCWNELMVLLLVKITMMMLSSKEGSNRKKWWRWWWLQSSDEKMSMTVMVKPMVMLRSRRRWCRKLLLWVMVRRERKKKWLSEARRRLWWLISVPFDGEWGVANQKKRRKNEDCLKEKSKVDEGGDGGCQGKQGEEGHA